MSLWCLPPHASRLRDPQENPGARRDTGMGTSSPDAADRIEQACVGASTPPWAGPWKTNITQNWTCRGGPRGRWRVRSGGNSRSRPPNPRSRQLPGVAEPFPGVNSTDRSANPGVTGRFPGDNSRDRSTNPGVAGESRGVLSRGRSTNPGVAGWSPGVNCSTHSADPPGLGGEVLLPPPRGVNRFRVMLVSRG